MFSGSLARRGGEMMLRSLAEVQVICGVRPSGLLAELTHRCPLGGVVTHPAALILPRPCVE
jgi:hypothetical protein